MVYATVWKHVAGAHERSMKAHAPDEDVMQQGKTNDGRSQREVKVQD